MKLLRYFVALASALWCVTPFAAPASRIVSLGPNLTELAFSAGAGDRIVGTVEYSDYPDAARAIPRIGDAFQLDYERIVALQPQIVLAWEPGTSPAAVERLQSLGLTVVTIRTHHLSDIGAAVREIGRIAGADAAATAAAADFDRRIERLRGQHGGSQPVSVFLQVNSRPLYTVNGKQIMSEVISLCGGRNAFASLGELAPQIGVEAVIAANPDVILVIEAAPVADVDQWLRWKHLRAVRSDNVVRIDPDDLARSTLRLAQGAEAVCRTLETARARLQRLE